MNERIRSGLTKLVARDRYLLENGVNERSITHRLGLYCQGLFPEWDVDCEFNKNLGEPKEAYIDPRVFLGKMADLLENSDSQDNHSKVVGMLREERVTQQDIADLKYQLRDESRIGYDTEL